jgi:hypothetical protein
MEKTAARAGHVTVSVINTDRIVRVFHDLNLLQKEQHSTLVKCSRCMLSTSIHSLCFVVQTDERVDKENRMIQALNQNTV